MLVAWGSIFETTAFAGRTSDVGPITETIWVRSRGRTRELEVVEVAHGKGGAVIPGRHNSDQLQLLPGCGCGCGWILVLVLALVLQLPGSGPGRQVNGKHSPGLKDGGRVIIWW